jgi:hypothetical protein
MDDIEHLTDPEVAALAAKARGFLAQQHWVKRITGGQVGYAVPGAFGVFQFRIEPERADIPSELWVVAGDLPPAYFASDDDPTWEAALDSYIWQMQRWVDAVRAGQPVEDLIPVDVAPTPDHAELLASRLDLLRRRVLGRPGTAVSDA